MNQKLIITASLAAIILSGCDCGVRNEVTTKPESLQIIQPEAPVAYFEIEYGPRLNAGPQYIPSRKELGLVDWTKWYFGPRWEFLD